MDPFLAVIVSGVAMFAAHILFILLFRTKPTPTVKVAKVGDPVAPVDAGGAEAQSVGRHRFVLRFPIN